MAARKKRAGPPARYSLAGVVPVGSGFGLRWSGDTPDPRTFSFPGFELPAERCWAWNAEQVGLHLWCDYPPDVGARVRGWFSTGRVSTLGIGSRYLYSASRWLVDPLETPDALAGFGAELQAGMNGSLGIPLKGSPGTAAVAVWRQIVGRVAPVDQETNDYCELAIYGGRNELAFRGPEQGPLVQWDRGSAYLAHLLDPLPIPGSERWTTRPDLTREGITEAIVSADPGKVGRVPVLPCHVELRRGERRTVYPYGTFVGRWPNVELRAALERGYDVRPKSGLVFTKSGRIPSLARFAERIWSAREKFPMAKRIGVALVGKLHEPRVSRIVRPFGPFETREERSAAAKELGEGAIVVDRARVALQLQRRDEWSWYVNMPWAAHVLALARLELLRAIEANPWRILSVATDGMIVTGEAPLSGVKHGTGLGEWRVDTRAVRGVVYGPTAYRLVRADGSEKVRTAGISRALAGKFLAGETVRWKTRAGLMGRGYAGLEVERTATAAQDTAAQTDEEGWVWPHHVKVVQLPDGRLVNRIR